MAGVADGDLHVNAAESRKELVVDGVVNDEASEGGAALAGGAHGAEGHGSEGKREVGGGADDGGVVAAELEQTASEAGGEAGAYGAAHAGAAGGGDEGHQGRVDEGLADGVVAEEEGGEVGQDLRGEVVGVLGGKLLGGSEEEGLGREGGEGGLFGRLPDDGVSADEGEGGVPAPDGDGEVEGGDDAGDAQGVPLLHHAVVGALGGDGDAADGARKARGVDADVDHLLDLAAAFGEDLSGLYGDQAAEAVEVGAKLFGKQAGELSTEGHGDGAPVEISLVGEGEGCLRIGGGGKEGQLLAGDGGMGGVGAGGESLLGDAEVQEKGAGLFADAGVGAGLGAGLGAHWLGPIFPETCNLMRCKDALQSATSM